MIPTPDIITATDPRPWWETVDWTKPRSVIAAETGVCEATVTRRARRLGHTIKRQNNYASFDRASLDWTQPIKALASDTGISRVTLHKWRNAAIKAGTVIPGLKRKSPWGGLTGMDRTEVVELVRQLPIGSVLWLPIPQIDAAGISHQLTDRRLIVHQYHATPARSTHQSFDIVRIEIAEPK